ncbi:MAG: methyltransferase domain-containing protein [Planctomycetes bacterium]|nr:methyltransferase domain-containing protein [Planctomycetota bacterium]
MDRRETARRAAAFWNREHAAGATTHDNFLSHPLVQFYISMRAFGQPVGHMDVVIAELRSRTRPGDAVVSIGSGPAHKERALARALPDRSFVGIDIAADIVATVTADARAEGLTNLELRVGDFNALELETGRYRAVLGLGALHHVENLEGFWAASRAGLAPDGVILAQEYVGPDRFQWTPAQVEHGDRVLRDVIPAEHKIHHDHVVAPSVEAMLEIDPSEAVRSSELVSTCRAAGFELVGYAGAGCSLLQPVLIGQIETFDPLDWSHGQILARLFAEEQRLLADGTLTDDFAMFVARPR